MSVLVVVPYRPDGGHRDLVWRRLRDTYWRNTYTLVMGVDDRDGPFNRSAALNAAADADDCWSVVVIADADTWVPPAQLREAVGLAERTGRLVAAFDAVMELSEGSTTQIVAGEMSLSSVEAFRSVRVRVKDLETQSSMLVVPRVLWDAVGGFDERFAGWGGEDNAFWRACSILGGQPYRVHGFAYHLWHPSAPGKHRGDVYEANYRLWLRYAEAHTVSQLRQVMA